jgi:hypothetical protein
MAGKRHSRACASRLLSAENGCACRSGTRLAIIELFYSCDLAGELGSLLLEAGHDPDAMSDAEVREAVERLDREARETGRALEQPAFAKRQRACREVKSGTWGGARNRADRVSHHLTRKQCEGLLAAAAQLEKKSVTLSRHWTVHHEAAGIPDSAGAAFVGRLLSIARRHVRRAGGELAALWVRENGDGKGAHVHILLALPDGFTLRNRTRRWIEAAGGTYRKGVSKVRQIGGTLSSASRDSERHAVNVRDVLAYLLKAADAEAGRALGLARYGEGGKVIGKRCGRTQNLGEDKRAVR